MPSDRVRLFRLHLLNGARWLREYAFVWGLLSAIYSLTLTILLQAILEPLLKNQLGDLKLTPLWIATCGSLLIPGILEALPLPVIPWQASRLRTRGLVGAYLRHDLRRGNTWLVVLLSAALGAWIVPKAPILWILAVQLPSQRALFSIHRWRVLALIAHPEQGARELMKALWISQLIQAGVAWLLMSLFSGAFSFKLGATAACAVISAMAVAFEGDSGRPWVVNFMALAVGLIGGALIAAHGSFFVFELYLWIKMLALVKERLRSVEHLDEDVIIP